MHYSIQDVEKMIKIINNKYYLDITNKCQLLFGDQIVKQAFITLDAESIIFKSFYEEHLHKGTFSQMPSSGEYIGKMGIGQVFEKIANQVLDDTQTIQMDNSEGIEQLSIEFTNGKQIHISNSEWGSISCIPGGVGFFQLFQN